MSEESEKLAAEGRPRFTEIPRIERLEPIPVDWKPRHSAPHVTNFVLNGAILNNVAALFHGDTVTGNKVVNAVLTSPAI